jgi:hypothetical protein
LDSALYFLGAILCFGSNPYDFFSSSNGLRQGYLFSSLLFVIVMEALSRMLFAFVNGGLLSSFSVGSRNFDVLNISHLLFVNDTLIFCRVIHTTYTTCVLYFYFLRSQNWFLWVSSIMLMA